MTTVRVALPVHLQTLARVDGELQLDVAGAVTINSLLDALESSFPALRGTIREYGTERRRAYIRYFACGQDLSHDPADTPLPDCVASGADTFCVIGAISGG
jgi:sulfur-carrier protein